MASKLFPSLAATAFAAILFYIFLKRRSREINRGEANNNAAANDGIAGGASGAHTSTENHGMGTFAAMLFNFFLKRRSREINGGEANKNAAANNGIAGGAAGAHPSTESHGMDTIAAVLFYIFLKRRSREINGGEANNNAAANDGIAGGASGAHTSTESHGMGTFAAMLFNFFLKRRSREINEGEAYKNAASNNGIAGGAAGAHPSTESHGMDTLAAILFYFFLKRRPREINGRYANNIAAADDGIAGGASGAHTSTESNGMGTFAAMLFYIFLKRRSRDSNGGEANNNAAANDGMAGGASGVHTSIESHGTGTSSGYDYEVFLSFRGPDTRAAFTDFLYTSLDDAGIRTFKDDEDLRKGEEFAPELLQAIKQSKILIPIFSKNYASSVWCLKEVVQMVECIKNGGQKIMPIFYDVAPTEVRYQTGVYENAFLSHESKKRYDQMTIGEWKDALTAVAGINGWDLQSMPNRREGEFIKTFTQKVFNELKRASLVVSDYLVGVDHHVDKIMGMIGSQTSETRIIGIHGMGGIGKTSIAKIIYNQLSENFEGCCFLSNVRETSKLKGIQCLQHQLISDILNVKWMEIRNIDEGIKTIKNRLSNKKILLLLDDVEENDHMNALVGNHDWFGKGSKVIITTRKKDVIVPKVDYTYEVNGMDDYQSLQLFSKHAFRRDSPLDEYIDQSKRAIGIAGGLPLALEVIGSLLSRSKKKKWDDTLEKLKNVPHVDVQSKLKISFDALEVKKQHIFLDIACLFIGCDKDIMVHFWEKSNFFPKEAMEVLQNMSLIKINEKNEVWMHDQLRDLGREMVRQESNTKMEKQSRVWDLEKGFNLLRRHKGKKEVEALRLDLDRHHYFTFKDFKSLPNLTFLEVKGAKGTLPRHTFLPTNVFRKNSNLLPQLRWLSWHDIPPTFKISYFSMENVVVLDLSKSRITHYWKGWSHMKVMKNLKVLDLTDCKCLKRTPKFFARANLERLILRGCYSLIEIDRSICHLKRLVSLDVRECKKLRRLPNELGGDLASLEYLYLSGCESLEWLPNTIGKLELLTELDISQTSIKELPDPIGKFKNLKVVKMCDSGTSKIPDAFWMIENLEEIYAMKEYVREDLHVKIGNCICKNQSLRILRLANANIYALPRLPESLIELQLSELYMDTFPDLSNLTNLKVLILIFGPRHHDGESNGLVEDPIPRSIGNLIKLESMYLYSDYETHLPTDLSLLPQLNSLRLVCPNQCHLPRLPSSLPSLELSNCKSLCSMDLSNLKKLLSLLISPAAISEIQGLSCLGNLRDLWLSSLGHLKILPDLSNLTKLRSLRVDSCDNLIEIQGELPESLENLEIYSCESLQKLPDLLSLMRKKGVSIADCKKLNGEAIS